jgi:hypothetical protein
MRCLDGDVAVEDALSCGLTLGGLESLEVFTRDPKLDVLVAEFLPQIIPEHLETVCHMTRETHVTRHVHMSHANTVERAILAAFGVINL